MLTERLSFGFVTVVVKYLHCKNKRSYDLTAILLVKFHPCLIRRLVKKGKAVLLQAWSGPDGSRKLRFPDYMTTAQDGGKAVSLMHQPPSNDTSWDRTSDLPICSTAP